MARTWPVKGSYRRRQMVPQPKRRRGPRPQGSRPRTQGLRPGSVDPNQRAWPAARRDGPEWQQIRPPAAELRRQQGQPLRQRRPEPQQRPWVPFGWPHASPSEPQCDPRPPATLLERRAPRQPKPERPEPEPREQLATWSALRRADHAADAAPQRLQQSRIGKAQQADKPSEQRCAHADRQAGWMPERPRPVPKPREPEAPLRLWGTPGTRKTGGWSGSLASGPRWARQSAASGPMCLQGCDSLFG
jgi:hypothetical protein